MDKVFAAIERVALPKRVVYADFAAAPAMFSYGKPMTTGRSAAARISGRYFSVRHGALALPSVAGRQNATGSIIPQFPTALTNDKPDLHLRSRNRVPGAGNG
jgi:hypothetical protein